MFYVFVQMERERERKRQARRAASQATGGVSNGDDLGNIKGLNKKTSGTGEFDDLIMALKTGEVFGVGDLNQKTKGGKKGKVPPKTRSSKAGGRERVPL